MKLTIDLLDDFPDYVPSLVRAYLRRADFSRLRKRDALPVKIEGSGQLFLIWGDNQHLRISEQPT